MPAQDRFENDVCAILRSFELRVGICLAGEVFRPVWLSGDATLRFLPKSCFFLAYFCFATSFFFSLVFFFGFLPCFIVFVCLRRDLRRLVALSCFLFCLFFFRFNFVFSVSRFRAISTFFSGIRGPLEHGARMAGTGGLVKRPNFDNASFA